MGCGSPSVTTASQTCIRYRSPSGQPPSPSGAGTEGPVRMATPSSSRISRCRASVTDSPGSTLPPGNSQPPASAGGSVRRAARSRVGWSRSSTIAAATTSSRSTRPRYARGRCPLRSDRTQKLPRDQPRRRDRTQMLPRNPRDRRCGLVSLSLDDNALPGGNDGPVDATDPEALLAAHEEPHGDQGSTGARLNWLRAGVLGANDGIVSTAGVIAGVAGATAEPGPVLTAGVAALVAGALSMGVGEYVSVSTQRDTESALLAKERRELRDEPEAELAELTHLYEDKGLDPELAHQVAVQLTARDALAALASMGSFVVGALLPLLAVVIAPHAVWAAVLVAAVVLALVITGVVSARLGGMSPTRQVARNVTGGLLAMTVTYGIGVLVGPHL